MWPRAAQYNMAGGGLDTHELEQWFPTFFSLAYLLAAYFHKLYPSY